MRYEVEYGGETRYFVAGSPYHAAMLMLREADGKLRTAFGVTNTDTLVTEVVSIEQVLTLLALSEKFDTNEPEPPLNPTSPLARAVEKASVKLRHKIWRQLEIKEGL